MPPPSPDPVASSRLARDYWPLAMRIARQFARRYPFLALEFESDAALALWQAAKSYQADRGKFSTWAAYFIQGKLGARVRSERRKNLPAFQPQRRETGRADDDPVRVLVDPGPTPEDVAIAAEDAEQVREQVNVLLATLPPKRGELIRRRFIGSESATALAREWGVSRSALSNWITADLATLRTAAAG